MEAIFCRIIPRSVFVVQLAVVVLYVFVNVAFIAVLGPEDIRKSSAVAMVTIICFSQGGGGVELLIWINYDPNINK